MRRKLSAGRVGSREKRRVERERREKSRGWWLVVNKLKIPPKKNSSSSSRQARQTQAQAYGNTPDKEQRYE